MLLRGPQQSWGLGIQPRGHRFGPQTGWEEAGLGGGKRPVAGGIQEGFGRAVSRTLSMWDTRALQPADLARPEEPKAVFAHPTHSGITQNSQQVETDQVSLYGRT